MKKKLLMICASVLMGVSIAQADTYTGIIVTTEGGDTSYALSDMPKVTYGEKEGVKTAMLTLQGKTEPSVTVLLKDGKQLIVTYGTYTPTSIEDANAGNTSITVKNGKKYITGGRLVVVGKDGKLYNTEGTEIK